MNTTSLSFVRYATGAVMIAFGISQIVNPKSWTHYEPEWLKKILPVSSELFMQSHGGINVGLGLLFVSGWRLHFISWTTYLWWLSILPFAFKVDWRSGARDFIIVMSLLAITLNGRNR